MIEAVIGGSVAMNHQDACFFCLLFGLGRYPLQDKSTSKLLDPVSSHDTIRRYRHQESSPLTGLHTDRQQKILNVKSLVSVHERSGVEEEDKSSDVAKC